jgi:hypothetical protein
VVAQVHHARGDCTFQFGEEQEGKKLEPVWVDAHYS